MSAELRLYDYWRSAAAYRVRIGLNLKGLAYEHVAVNILPGADEQFQAAFRALNPQSRVPVLQTAAGEIDQSLAILEWMDETHPAPPLLPADPWARAQVRAFALTIAADIHPLGNLSVLKQLREQFSASEADLGVWRERWFGGGMAALEQRLAGRPETPFAFGDTPGLADICLVPQIYGARRFGLDLTAFPRLVKLAAIAEAHPAFAAAAPERQPDSVRPPA
ncbi:MAG TPA: maleylacetoacetate isomerase [Caulobacteraceae bacterium]|jgi:maleylacetoacetate isomerase